ncbi:TetR/AcrR family transcriptional regulator [Amycolatopsis sp. CA-230715]|uniref:TetR/AcrR family transcriptional regulator n=1 Tax=Amycolatopsis sp. CA-230715 TaxID=2745196 RepID=UPI001C00CD49|nr:TetR/AcrR family transcriptional regulator [Amycolatopsis sp. CA-230715]QWF80018.1 Nucleoid occlusion factor SlmA [Amycolatopsis sp. CA-230715]
MGTRDEIVRAAATVMRAQGYARATTKEIARAAGYSEAALYKHFPDKTEIFLAVLTEEMPALHEVLAALPERADTATLQETLTEVVTEALSFYIGSFPIAVSVFSSRELLTEHRSRLSARGLGPRHPIDQLASYLELERDHGALRTDTDPRALAALLFGACFQEAFLINFAGERPDGKRLAELAGRLVKTALAPLLEHGQG